MDTHEQAEGTPEPADEPGSTGRRPLTVRVPHAMLDRIDHAARRLGLSRSAFMLAATAKRMERMEKGRARG